MPSLMIIIILWMTLIVSLWIYYRWRYSLLVVLIISVLISGLFYRHVHYSSDVEHFNHFAAYSNCEMRRSLLDSPTMSTRVLSLIVKTDPDLGVRHDAKQRLEFLSGVSFLEKNARLPTAESEKIALLREQARNSFDENQLIKIFNEAMHYQEISLVLLELANNCFMTPELAQQIYKRASLIKNYSRIEIFVALSTNPKTSTDVLNQLAQEKELVILRALASNPHLPMEIMQKLAPYPDCKIRKKIICLPRTPTNIIMSLQQDADNSVAEEARARLQQVDDYLSACVEPKKLNASCRQFFDNYSPIMHEYPNTSDSSSSIIQKSILKKSLL